MKFIDYIEKIGGVNTIGMVSFAIFFTVFTVACIMVFRGSKKTMNEISQIPLDN